MGSNLLILKEEKLKIEDYDKSILKNAEIIDTETTGEHHPDPKGCFKIFLERDKGDILLLHYRRSNMKQPESIIRGKNPKDVYMAASEKGLLSTLEHAAYLGSEVEKAFIALKLERSYIQDTSLF
jgi:dihydropteroate synthase